jgi:hypothetical protein
MLRRDAKAIIAAHEINKQLRELYVEGSRDKLLFEWLLGRSIAANSYVVEIDSVEVANVVEGGNRTRLLRFAEQVLDSGASIRCFADRDSPDQDATPAKIPDNVLMSDGRDLESYVLTEKNLQKVIKVGCGIAELEAATVLPAVMELARRMAAMRVMSDRKGWKLPFARGGWTGAITSNRRSVGLNNRRALASLLQSAKVSLKELNGALSEIDVIMEEQRQMPDIEVVRGKDAMIFLGAILRHHGVDPRDTDKLMWTSLDERSIDQYPNLLSAVSFLSRDNS